MTEAAILISAILSFLPAVPASRYGKFLKSAGIGKMTVYVQLSILAAFPALCFAASSSLTGVPAFILILAFLLSFSSGYGIDLLRAHLTAESKPALPAEVSAAFRLNSVAAWIGRVMISTITFWSVLTAAFDPAAYAPLAISGAALAAAMLSVLSLMHAYSRKKARSEAVHASEVGQFLLWADRQPNPAVIHIPDAKQATLKELGRLLEILKKRGISAAILCRGRKAFAAVKQKHADAWLIRTTHDLDSYAVTPITACYHMPAGTNGSHIVSLRKLRQVLVDTNGLMSNVQTLPKEVRMFDEIWLADAPSAQMASQASSYGIELKAREDAPALPPVLPAMPHSPVGLTGLFVSGGPEGDPFGAFGRLVPVLDAMTEKFGTDYTLMVWFDGVDKAHRDHMLTGLRTAIDPVSVRAASSAEHLFNSARCIITNVGDLPGLSRRRILITSPDEVANIPRRNG